MQAIDDDKAIVLASANDVQTRKAVVKGKELTKSAAAVSAAELMVAELKKAKVSAVVFDRGQYKYHGRVKAIAQVLRDGGIEV